MSRFGLQVLRGMKQPSGHWRSRKMAVRATICITLLVAAEASWANSCLLDRPDADRLEGRVGKRDVLSIGKVAVSPCEGRVAAADAMVLHSRGGGITQLTLVKAGLDLKDAISRPLQDIAMPGGLLGSLWTSLTAPRPTRSASKRFDDIDGLVLGGQVLAGRELWVPLSRFGWDPSLPVRLVSGNNTFNITPQDGLVLLPAQALAAGDAVLQQGRRSAQLDVIAPDAFDGLQAQLEQIGASSTGERLRWLRQTVLFFEWGLLLNATDADARMSKAP